jgi:hypothetical protein
VFVSQERRRLQEFLERRRRRRRRRDHPQDQDVDDGGGGGGDDDVGVVASPRESITREEDSIENSEPKGDENHWRRKKITDRILNS